MADPAQALESADDFKLPPSPDMSNAVTEDDQPVDNWFSEREMRLLTDCLDASFRPGMPFLCGTNVGLFYADGKEATVPDFLLSMNVRAPADIWEKGNRSYVIWRYAKPPDLVIEIVSNKIGGEDTSKLELYQSIRVPYYVIHDPRGFLSRRPVRLYELKGTRYVEWADSFARLDQLGLQLTLWEGDYQQMPQQQWLRWRDAQGELLLTGVERAEQALQRSELEHQRAEQEHLRAEQMARKLRELGIDPSEFG